MTLKPDIILKSGNKVPLAAAMLVALGSLTGASPASGYKTYTNSRFGYSVCYPAGLLSPQPEADNGDGRKFLGPDGAVLLVYGMNNALAQSLQELYQEELNSYNKPSASAAYKVLNPTWFVVSGTKQDRIIYRKTFLKNNQFKTFQLEYGKSQKLIYDRIVSKISACFRG